jgi:hypothetical protein
MEENLKKESDTDISKKIEEIFLGILLLFGKMILTFYHFMRRPHAFGSTLLDSDPLEKGFPKKYCRPITYFFISLCSSIGGTILVFTIIPKNIFERELNDPYGAIHFIKKAFEDESLSKLIISSLPAILGMALFSFCLSWINRKNFPQISFLNNFFLLSYFIGSIFLISIVMVPFITIPFALDISSSSSILVSVIILTIVNWIFQFRAFYCYLVLLKQLVKGDRKTTLKVFSAGILFFLVVYIAIQLWLLPISYLRFKFAGG